MALTSMQRPAAVPAVPTTTLGGESTRLAREFARARRHSRVVRLLKLGLPVFAALIVLVGVGVTWLARAMPENLSLASAGIEDGRIVMDGPRIDGFDKSNRPYSMSAERAVQAIDGSGVDLEGVSARLAVSNDLSVDITARGGHYDAGTETLLLSDAIHVATSDGMTIELSRATLRPAAGTLDGEGPVAIRTATQSIDAGAVSVSENGDRLRFSGGLKMILQPRSTHAAGTSDDDLASAQN
ncbi:LPS export ABC transporter periplasmic protein LptC [Antarcticirhabdus aurantiaca]|uniref:Uncharacterized protein n=2 Tax=Antarcticirhabdus aurantiaca TaxID=2606717 RepID=A0ACD4NQH7_9HYPH|nr:hypothetical protein OXU80_01905 [Jeongeuplla avenae]